MIIRNDSAPLPIGEQTRRWLFKTTQPQWEALARKALSLQFATEFAIVVIDATDPTFKRLADNLTRIGELEDTRREIRARQEKEVLCCVYPAELLVELGKIYGADMSPRVDGGLLLGVVRIVVMAGGGLNLYCVEGLRPIKEQC